jgi:predicted naringenin-chalcone synthase
MTWNISSAAFRMFLSTKVVDAIKNNMQSVFNSYHKNSSQEITHWAIHPGGIKIVEAVQRSMGLKEEDVSVSMDILKNYGNMSSATILFILERMFNELKTSANGNEKIFTCAFGPGVNVEMMCMEAIKTSENINMENGRVAQS